MTNKVFSWVQMLKVQSSENRGGCIWELLFNVFRLLPRLFCSPLFPVEVHKVNKIEPKKTVSQANTVKGMDTQSMLLHICFTWPNTYCKIRKAIEKRMAVLPPDWKLSRLALPGRAVAATHYTPHTVLTTRSDSIWCQNFFWITPVCCMMGSNCELSGSCTES